MSFQPTGVPKPNPADWPRASTSKSNPAIALPPTQTPTPATFKTTSIPEIDMTAARKPAPTMRFTSDVEDAVDVDGTIDHLPLENTWRK
ncbi:hypothetical protein M408DRAFT_333269 [Serendipita vermifera MAFF 305830]|uniref:Uncharacterized protein n=1 Tax=Serendipita vermifera MAFF 305830 TaxID=933852 RepID=A0A0C2W5K9_SERVB|nr:hypothetical protein M408DRAFT_333269 [Serendipita vermifera MAFF 305830]